jgi:YidC/Oxa1 family membrane protein insertase
MDRNAIIGLVLVAVILITFSWLNPPSEESADEPESKDTTKRKVTQVDDTLKPVVKDSAKTVSITEVAMQLPDSLRSDSAAVDSLRTVILQQEKAKRFGAFASAVEGKEEHIVIGNKQVRITLSNKGAIIRKVELPEYLSYGDYAADKSVGDAPLVIADSNFVNAMRFNIVRDQPMPIQTEDLYYTVVSHDSSKAVFRLNTSEPGSYVDITYSLGDRDYEVKYKVQFHQMGKVLRPEEVEYLWAMRNPSIEKNIDQERQISGVYYQYKGESWDYLNEMSDESMELEARAEWIAFKQNYFSAILLNESGSVLKGGTVAHVNETSGDYVKSFSAELSSLALENLDSDTLALSFYFGPNEYEYLLSYDNGMHRIVAYGPGMIGWVNRNFFQPVFNALSGLGISFGIVILLLTLVVRVIITPLVFRNYKSSAKMRVMKPEVEEIGKKYPDRADAMKKQQEVMALYRSVGVNPMAGCVPMIIQIPILFAMFRFIPSVFEIRQKNFLWAEDLSAFDSVASLGFEIPFYGSHVSLFTLLMAASTLAYTLVNSNQITPQAGMPNMKWMMYLFPVMMIFFFNNYAAGLSYYYLLGNLMSMGVMFIIKKYFIDEQKIRATLDENRLKPKKMSKFQQRLQDMQKQQQQRAQQNNRASRRKK